MAIGWVMSVPMSSGSCCGDLRSCLLPTSVGGIPCVTHAGDDLAGAASPVLESNIGERRFRRRSAPTSTVRFPASAQTAAKFPATIDLPAPGMALVITIVLSGTSRPCTAR